MGLLHIVTLFEHQNDSSVDDSLAIRRGDNGYLTQQIYASRQA